jgi:hypothetical protein
MILFSLTLLAVVKVTAYTALVSDSLDGYSLAAIASYSLMNLGLLISSSFSKVVDEESLESLSSV